MARLEEQNPLDYRQGGDTVDDFAQKYMKEINRIYQFLNNLREHNATGTYQVEPAPYQLMAEEGKLYVRNEENTAWLYLFDIKYRMGITENSAATILTTDDVTSTAEALKLVKTNADGKIDVDTTGNANTATTLQTGRTITISDYGANNSGVATTFDGSTDVTIALPETVQGKFVGTFSGDLTGTFTGEAGEYIKKTAIDTVETGSLATTPNKIAVINENGVLPVSILGNAAKLAGINVTLSNPEDGQVLAYRVATNTISNENRAVVGDAKALHIYDGETLIADYAGGKEVTVDLETTSIKADITANTEKLTQDLENHNTSETAHEDIRESLNYVKKHSGVVGQVIAYAGNNTLPEGYLLCDGSAVSRTDYADLFAVIGTTYGTGNGSTTFNLPNLVGRFIEGGSTAGTVYAAGLPNITGQLELMPWNNSNAILNNASGCLSYTARTGKNSNTVDVHSNTYKWTTVYFEANSSSSVYGGSSTVQPPALLLKYIIKY